jgi:hypothetical protein
LSECSNIASLAPLCFRTHTDLDLRYQRACPPTKFGPGGERAWYEKEGLLFYQDGNYKKDWGAVGLRSPQRFPEDRVRWRHESRAQLDADNEDYKERISKYLRKRTLASNGPYKTQWLPNNFKLTYQPEIVWRIGTYDMESIEQRRGHPAWDDLLDYRTATLSDGLSSRTANFFRNIAYRMGLTFRHSLDIRNKQPRRPRQSSQDLEDKRR